MNITNMVNARRIGLLLLVSVLLITISACSGNVAAPGAVQTSDTEALPQTTSTTNIISTTTSTFTTSEEYDSDDGNTETDSSEISYIKLDGDSIFFDGTGATVHENKIVITSPGTYELSGKLDDGQIIVDTGASERVKLILNSVNIYCSSSAPIYLLNAEKTIITLADGSDNYVTDGSDYVLEDIASGEPNAAIFSNDDLTINGGGSLTVEANYNNGIQSKDDLKITDGNITITAVNDGIKGRDSIAIKDGNITINAGDDGMQSNNDEDPGEGIVLIEDGNIVITAQADGIQAETSLVINGGDITISTGGGSANASNNVGNPGNTWGSWNPANDIANDNSPSAKGLKAATDLTITGGTITIDSSDDSIHSNDSITISGGNITLSSGDDGMHSDTSVEISGGDICILKSYEGIESSIIAIQEGNLRLVSSDDGINIVGGIDGSAFNRPGQNNFTASGTYYLNINGGYIVIDAGGDGLDINGPITMTGGTVIINGPTRNDNGALDFASFKITGGLLIAVGSSGMAQAPGTTSTQYSIMVNFSSTQAAGSIFHLESKGGEEIITFIPTKTYQSFVVSSPQLQSGTSYLVFTGGTITGTAIDGLCSEGTYTPGNQVFDTTISGITTVIGSSGGMFPWGNMMPPGGR